MVVEKDQFHSRLGRSRSPRSARSQIRTPPARPLPSATPRELISPTAMSCTGTATRPSSHPLTETALTDTFDTAPQTRRRPSLHAQPTPSSLHNLLPSTRLPYPRRGLISAQSFARPHPTLSVFVSNGPFLLFSVTAGCNVDTASTRLACEQRLLERLIFMGACSITAPQQTPRRQEVNRTPP